jgi:hypothetical protein
MQWLLLLGSLVIRGIIRLIQAIANWLKTARCSQCGVWFSLGFVRFDVTEKTIANNNRQSGIGYYPGFKGGLGGGTSYTNYDPFIREWGKAHYRCKKCGGYLTLETHRDRR